MAEDTRPSFEVAYEEALAAARKGALCTVGKLLAGLTEQQRAFVESKMALPKDDLAGTVIEDMLKRVLSTSPSATTINRHRRGGCKCQA